jgi:hypothetical protein
MWGPPVREWKGEAEREADARGKSGPGGNVVQPSELFRLKCASHCYLDDTNSMHLNGTTHWSVGSPPDTTTVQ